MKFKHILDDALLSACMQALAPVTDQLHLRSKHNSWLALQEPLQCGHLGGICQQLLVQSLRSPGCLLRLQLVKRQRRELLHVKSVALGHAHVRRLTKFMHSHNGVERQGWWQGKTCRNALARAVL